MLKFTKPLLAASLLKSTDEHTDEVILSAMQKLRYPVLATLKLDGIRVIKLDKLVSRTLKPIPNKSIQARAIKLPAGFDMELYNPSLAFDEIESIVMSREHERSDEIQFHVLDWIQEGLWCYEQRLNNLKNIWPLELMMVGSDTIYPFTTKCNNALELFAYFIKCEENQGEGICFRTPNSPYKQNRSTLREQYLVKLCRNLTSEAIIIGFEEAMENTNPENRNAVGSMDRSSHGHGMVGKNTLGALVVRDIKSNKEFKIGTGFDNIERRDFWNNKKHFLNSVITYKYKGGGKDLPRCAVFKNFRKDI